MAAQQLHHPEAGKGLLYGIISYLIWGFFPIYFKAIAAVPPLQVVSHRIAWSVLFLSLLISWRSRWSDIRDAMTQRSSLLILIGSALLIATNWLVFIIAVEHGQVLQSSLGYFITPFVSVLLGLLFLKERLRRLQLAALLLAAAGVLILTVRLGSFPWTALILALTFGSYGLLRKVVKADPLSGLTVETFLLAPLACGYLAFVAWRGDAAFVAAGMQTSLLLMSAGVVTAVPLLLFAAAARRLRLATVGFLQYITPTLHFLLAVLVYKEQFTSTHLASFLLIWAGLAAYSWDAYRALADLRRIKDSDTL
ncbi:EamA family transporter RarD [Geobacter sp. SVR]|uniref:EamA family transporter RarD n=1 Tax=Geobacter sp. SVR TaxID=2495594 RepID=UPI00143EF49D|nr:EamA family transporter RarD [Geobacter sp. SVR]BCS52832.1 chloramphenicol resistance permease RarD [Geobacter sp. SVR]GCF86699.1 chloramphenicol resistance permease RarD [Geobacter sp. SVR]